MATWDSMDMDIPIKADRAGGADWMAPAGVAPQVAPLPIKLLTMVVIGTSFYVAIEPAPSDFLFLCLICLVFLTPGLRFYLGLPVAAVFGLAIFSLLPMLWSRDPGIAWNYFAITAYLLLSWYVMVVLLSNYGPDIWDVMWKSFLFAATMAALIGLVSHFSNIFHGFLGMEPRYGNRMKSSFKDPNVYSPFLCAALMVVVWRMVSRRWFTPLSFALLLLFAVEILCAFSRGGYLNLALALALFLGGMLILIRRIDWAKRSVLMLVGAPILLIPVAVVFLAKTDLIDVLERRFSIQRYDVESRFPKQQQALNLFLENPFGVGPGQSYRELDYATHNLYLRVAVESGVFALLCFCLLLFLFFRTCFRRALHQASSFRSLYCCCFAIVAGILLNSLVIDSLHWRHLFLFLAVPFGLGLWERSQGDRAALPPD